MLLLQDFKSIEENNHDIHKIRVRLRFYEKEPPDSTRTLLSYRYIYKNVLHIVTHDENCQNNLPREPWAPKF
jgi:hypothetical protein